MEEKTKPNDGGSKNINKSIKAVPIEQIVYKWTIRP